MESQTVNTKKTTTTVAVEEEKKSSRSKWIAIVIVLLLIVGAGYKLASNRAQLKKPVASDVLKEVPVTVAPVTKNYLEENLSLVGNVAGISDVMVASESGGRIRSVNIKVGDHVGVGTVLYTVDSELSEAGLLAAQANYEKAKVDFERYERLYKDSAVTRAQYDAARLGFKSAEAQMIQARRQVSNTRITSPAAGVVVTKMFDVGAQVNPGTVVANVVDISRLKVKVNVAEKDAFKMKVGDKVQLTTDVYPGIIFPATIQSIAAKSDEAHTYPVEIILPNNFQNPLRAGMFARVIFGSVQQTEKITIPREALIGSIREPQVYVVENNVARLRNITVGRETGGRLEILKGLAAGENVVVNGQNNLTNNANVKVSQ